MNDPDQSQNTDPLQPVSGGSEPVDGNAAASNSTQARAQLVERTKNILLSPAEEWQRIDKEPATIGGIYRRHVIPLAAVPALASLIGSLVFGYSVLGITYRPPVLQAVVSAVVQYGLTLIGVFLLALVIDWLAPKFEATSNRVQAFKVAAYSATAAWVAGIFSLIPALSILTILGLYSLYLLYRGLPRLMHAPEEKALPYTGVVVLVMVVLGILIGALTAPITSQFGSGGIADAVRSDGNGAGTIAIPGVGTIDASEAENAANAMESLGKSLQGGAGNQAEPLDSKILGDLLPQKLAGLPVTESETSSGGAGAIGASKAKARYGSGEPSVTLEITDMAALGGIAAMTGAMNIERNRQTATGYERMGKVDGRMTNEKWDSESRRGTYGILVGQRVMVEATGRGVDIDQLKSAVHDLDLASVESALGAAR